MAFIGLLVVGILGYWSTCIFLKMEHYQTYLNYWFCTFLFDLCPATLVIGILYSMVIIQGLLLNGVIEKKSGFLTPWLFVSFIAIIGLAVNFGYVSWFTDLLFIFITNGMT